MKKKFLILALAVCMIAATFTGCVMGTEAERVSYNLSHYCN